MYRAAIPPALRTLIPEHGSRRVLTAIPAGLAARTPAELADRIGARWQHWRYRIEEITDPVAVAITLTRRGYRCPDLRCEDHVRLDTGHPCQACAAIGTQITQARLAAVQATDPDPSGSTVLTSHPADLLDPARPARHPHPSKWTLAEATTPSCPHGEPRLGGCALCRHGIHPEEPHEDPRHRPARRGRPCRRTARSGL